MNPEREDKIVSSMSSSRCVSPLSLAARILGSLFVLGLSSSPGQQSHRLLLRFPRLPQEGRQYGSPRGRLGRGVLRGQRGAKLRRYLTERAESRGVSHLLLSHQNPNGDRAREAGDSWRRPSRERASILERALGKVRVCGGLGPPGLHTIALLELRWV